ncbi:MAG TPA: hypothetical protein VKH61_01150, partial [Streptosporangiaceae bacterium]|nr:hypothetical protein [Streptosporangiaceae bacterium]
MDTSWGLNYVADDIIEVVNNGVTMHLYSAPLARSKVDNTKRTVNQQVRLLDYRTSRDPQYVAVSDEQ